MKSLFHSHTLFFLLLVFMLSCKHKKVEITAVHKGKTHKPAAKAPVVKNSGTTPADVSENTLQQKLGLSNKQIRESKLYSFINEWYGVPYKYGGCQKTGIDCSCFTGLLYEKVYNMKLARSAGDAYNECEKIGMEDAREGDLFFFKINSGSVSHVAVYLKNKLFVHSSTSRGVIINSMDEAYYKKYFFCAGRVKNPS